MRSQQSEGPRPLAKASCPSQGPQGVWDSLRVASLGPLFVPSTFLPDGGDWKTHSWPIHPCNSSAFLPSRPLLSRNCPPSRANIRKTNFDLGVRKTLIPIEKQKRDLPMLGTSCRCLPAGRWLLRQARIEFLSSGRLEHLCSNSVLVALECREGGRKPLMLKASWCPACGFAWGSVFWCGGTGSQAHTALEAEPG